MLQLRADLGQGPLYLCCGVLIAIAKSGLSEWDRREAIILGETFTGTFHHPPDLDCVRDTESIPLVVVSFGA